eukprot:403331963
MNFQLFEDTSNTQQKSQNPVMTQKSNFKEGTYKFNSQANDNISVPSLPKNLSKQEQQMIKDVHKNIKSTKTSGDGMESHEDMENMMIAMELLNKFKKDPNFIQRDLQQQKLKSNQILQEEDKSQNPSAKPLPGKKQEYFDPLLTQEERHRQIQEKRQKRIKEQKQKQLEEIKERAKPKDSYKLPSQTIKKDRSITQLKNGTSDNMTYKQQSLHQINSETNKQSHNKIMSQKSLQYAKDYEQDYDDNELNEIFKIKQDMQQIQLDPDDMIEKTRKETQKLYKATQDKQQEAKQIQDDIKKMKMTLKEEEKARKEFLLQKENKRKLEIEKQKMELEYQNSRKQMLQFKVQKVSIILDQILVRQMKRQKYQVFETLNQFNLELQFKEQKLARHSNFVQKRKFMKSWLKLTLKIQYERELEQYEKEKQKLIIMEQTAQIHRNRVLKRNCFKVLIKNIQVTKRNKEIEEEHDRMKGQIDSFFTNLREKAKYEEEKLQSMKIEKQQKEQMKSKLRGIKEVQQMKEISQISLENYQLSYENSQLSRIDEEQNTINPTDTQNSFYNQSVNSDDFRQYEDAQKSLQATQALEVQSNYSQSQTSQMESQNGNNQRNPNESQTQNSQISNSNNNQRQKQAPVKSQPIERPKHVLEMEQRAKERKDKRDQLDKIYQEKRQKQEEEKIQAMLKIEEEKKKKIQQEREAKIMRKKEEMQKLEEAKKLQELEQLKLKNAREYYNRGLMIKYVMLPLGQLVDLAQNKMLKASQHDLYRIKRKGLRQLIDSVRQQKYEEQLKQDQQERMADRLYQINTLKLAINQLQQNLVQCRLEKKRLQKRYCFRIKHKTYQAWKLALPDLINERKQIEIKEELLVSKFRLRRVGKQIIQAIKEYGKEVRVEKEKKAYKDKMWGKVNSWLTDFDKKSNLLLNDIDPSLIDKYAKRQPDSENQDLFGIQNQQQLNDSKYHQEFQTAAFPNIEHTLKQDSQQLRLSQQSYAYDIKAKSPNNEGIYMKTTKHIQQPSNQTVTEQSLMILEPDMEDNQSELSKILGIVKEAKFDMFDDHKSQSQIDNLQEQSQIQTLENDDKENSLMYQWPKISHKQFIKENQSSIEALSKFYEF